MAVRSTVGVIILASLIVLASSAVPQISKRQAANPPARIVEDAERDADITPVAQESFKCPDDFGFYPHHISCDKYWKCDKGIAELKTCDNGLAFDASDPRNLTENCDYLHIVECGERTQLEPPIGTADCPRRHGIFADEAKCDVFWICNNGRVSSRFQCPRDLAYDRKLGTCNWADKVPECRNEAKTTTESRA